MIDFWATLFNGGLMVVPVVLAVGMWIWMDLRRMYGQKRPGRD
jgi:hypothetical protein